MNRLKKWISALLLFALLATSIVGFAATTGTMNNSTEVFLTQDLTGPSLLTLSAGSKVTVLEEGSGWTKISWEGMDINAGGGYVDSSRIQKDSATQDLIQPTTHEGGGTDANNNTNGNNTSGDGNTGSNITNDSTNTNTNTDTNTNTNTNNAGDTGNNAGTNGSTGTGTNNTAESGATNDLLATSIIITTDYVQVNLASSSNRLNMYQNSDGSGTILATFANGEILKLVKYNAKYSKIDDGAGHVGYMENRYLLFNVNKEPDPPGTLYMYVSMPWNNMKANLYKTNSTTGGVVAAYYTGEKVEVTAWGSTWCEVKVVSDGNTGWMLTSQLSTKQDPNPPDDNYVEAVVNNANPLHYLNLRQSPSANSAVLGQYYNGTKVKVYDKGPIWSRVSVGSLYGYMMTEFLSFGDTPTPPTPSYKYAVVNNPVPTDRLNLRAGPSKGYASLGKYSNGTIVTVVEYGSTWCRVEVGGLTGYMMTYYLRFTDNPGPGPDPNPPGPIVGYAYVKNPGANQRLNLRERPSTSSRSLGQYYNNQRVKILSYYNSDWVHVEVNGLTGYMMLRYLSFTEVNAPKVGIVNNPVSTQVLNLRSYPSTSSRSLGQFRNGVVVSVLEYGPTWCYVEVYGTKGYMMTRYLRFP